MKRTALSLRSLTPGMPPNHNKALTMKNIYQIGPVVFPRFAHGALVIAFVAAAMLNSAAAAKLYSRLTPATPLGLLFYATGL